VDALERDLDEAQRLAVTTAAAPLAVLAAAGSGKTRVLTRRIAWRIGHGTASGDRVLALTFTRQAAGELTTRLRTLGVRDRLTVGTFHAVAWSALRRRWDDQGRRHPELLSDRARLVADVLTTDRHRRPAGEDVATVVTEIDWAKARLVHPDAYVEAAAAAGRRPRIPVARVADAFAAYEQARRRRRLVDFDDLLVSFLRELRDPTYAEVVRWRFRHVFVDEAQDLNPVQIRLLDAIVGGRPDLCLVGDPRQAIYGWNGADPTFLAEVGERYPGITIVRLERTYRSTAAITRAARAVLTEPADGPAATDGAGATDASSAAGRAPQIHAFADEQDEATGIARLVRAAAVGRSWAQLAVLARTNAQLPPLRRALEAAGIPVAGPPSWLEHPQVRLALADAERAGDLADWIAELAAGLHDPELDPQALAALDALSRRASALVATGVADDARDLRAALAEEPAVAVDVLTFHAAKGREWSAVVVAGCEEGLVPHAGARSGAARAEERRLLHVALTRAGTELHLTWAAQRNGAARVRSPLLAPIDATPPEPTVAPPAGLLAGRAPTPAADRRLAALSTWRRARARRTGLPEQAVLSDAVLAELARVAPTDRAGLEAVAGLGPFAADRLGASLVACLDACEPGSDGDPVPVVR
jgi:DNA helicase-2/ATP-dependent DNA helicase PcrA